MAMENGMSEGHSCMLTTGNIWLFKNEMIL
jgi:hypothetical protein